MRRAIAPLAVLGAVAAVAAAAPDPAKEARDAIWAKEMSIYEGRSRGMVDFYVENASPRYLAWTAGTSEPFGLDRLKAGAAQMRSRDKEIIKTIFKGFSLSGDTAIIYYQNHRTRLPDGTAVDQTYDNIHVWQKDAGDWKVLASMSRLLPTRPVS